MTEREVLGRALGGLMWGVVADPILTQGGCLLDFRTMLKKYIEHGINFERAYTQLAIQF